MTSRQQQCRRRPFSVVAMGDLVADLVLEVSHLAVFRVESQKARRATLEPGGTGNFLIAGARLGLKMHALGGLGDDLFGREVTQILAHEEIDVSGVVCTPGSSSTLVLVLIDEAGRHAFLDCYGEGPVLAFSDSWRSRVVSANAFFTNAYALSEQRVDDAVLEAVQTAYRARVTVFLDLGPDISPISMEARQVLYRQSTVILGTEEEVLLATKAADVETGAAVLLQSGAQVVVIKRGPKGCCVCTENQNLNVPAFSVPLRDSTAAGDTFDAAFVYGYLHGYSVHDTATFANAVAAAKIQKIGGGRQVPTAQEVKNLLHEYGVQHLYQEFPTAV